MTEEMITKIVKELRNAVETCDELLYSLQECHQNPMPEPERLASARAMLSQVWLYDRSVERKIND